MPPAAYSLHSMVFRSGTGNECYSSRLPAASSGLGSVKPCTTANSCTETSLAPLVLDYKHSRDYEATANETSINYTTTDILSNMHLSKLKVLFFSSSLELLGLVLLDKGLELPKLELVPSLHVNEPLPGEQAGEPDAAGQTSAPEPVRSAEPGPQHDGPLGLQRLAHQLGGELAGVDGPVDLGVVQAPLEHVLDALVETVRWERLVHLRILVERPHGSAGMRMGI